MNHNTIDTEEFSRDGFDFKIALKIDEVGVDTQEFYGKYSNSAPWGKFVIDRKYNGDQGRNEYRYFIPATDIDDVRGYYSRKLGYSRHMAYEIAKHTALNDYKAVEDLNNQRSGVYGVVVTIYRKGHQIGNDSLWGIETEGYGLEDDYIAYVKQDVISTALDDAIKTLEDLETKQKTLAHLRKLAEKIGEEARAENDKARRAYKITQFNRWRDLSANYQDNTTNTRHARNHFQNMPNRGRGVFWAISSRAPREDCPMCNRAGRVIGISKALPTAAVRCPQCGGSGRVIAEQENK